MRWRWWRPVPMPDRGGWPGPPARLPDPTVRPEPAEPGGVWLDLLPGYQADAARRALNEPTQILARPLMTLGQWYRGGGARQLPRSGSHG